MHKFYGIGDSHISCFSNTSGVIEADQWVNNDIFTVKRIGPLTAYNLIEKIGTSLTDSIDEVPKYSNLIFCFGEIDCRYHIYKQVQLYNICVDYVIQECVTRYVSFILKYSSDYNLIIWGVIPSILDFVNCSMFPSTGTYKDRIYITKKFNSLLEEECIINNIKFISIYNDIMDNKNYADFFVDGIHLCPQKVNNFIYNKFNTAGLI